MKVAHIVPTACLSLTRFNDYHLVLPHLMEDPTYAMFYEEEATGHKILDNGIAEAVEFDWDELLRIAHQIQADEVVVPDVMGDYHRTRQAVEAFRPFALANPRFNYIGVIQGKSYSEITACLAFYEVMQPWITTLAIPRVLANNIHRDIRWNFAEAFHDAIGARFTGGIHFLGASSNIKEVLQLKDAPNARGMDTSMPAVMGLDKRLIEVDSYIPRGNGFFEALPNDKQRFHIEHNLEMFVDWAR